MATWPPLFRNMWEQGKRDFKDVPKHVSKQKEWVFAFFAYAHAMVFKQIRMMVAHRTAVHRSAPLSNNIYIFVLILT